MFLNEQSVQSGIGTLIYNHFRCKMFISFTLIELIFSCDVVLSTIASEVLQLMTVIYVNSTTLSRRNDGVSINTANGITKSIISITVHDEKAMNTR